MFKQVAKYIRPSIRRSTESLIKMLAAYDQSRQAMNFLYRKLSFVQMAFVHRYFSNLFREEHGSIREGQWSLDFIGKRIRVPLEQKNFWLDWDCALSILGHDAEVKRTYAALIKSSTPPNLFIDVGTNYGTHSLLFLIHGIETLSFEPNLLCHDYFQRLCALNHVKSSIIPVALGNKTGTTELYFPDKETWLGTTDQDVLRRLESQSTLIEKTVDQHRLDDYLSKFEKHRLLIKIDTEGNEYSVLQGAVQTLEQYQPTVIFESLLDSNRVELFALFRTLGYGVANLPWLRCGVSPWINLSTFVESPVTNFIAFPMSEAH